MSRLCYLTDSHLKLKGSISVDVKIGTDDKDCWTLPKDLLTSYSTFFAAALAGDWSEARSNLVLLPDEDPGIFQVFVRWLYLGKLGENLTCISDKTAMEAAELWILGDKLGCPNLCKLVMLKLVSVYRDELYMRPAFIDLVFDNAPATSKLCLFATIQFIMDSMDTDLDSKGNLKAQTDTPAKDESFGAELVRLMPLVHRYLYLWCSHYHGFDNDMSIHYNGRVQLLIDRNPSQADIDLVKLGRVPYVGGYLGEIEDEDLYES